MADYLYHSARVRSLERNIIGHERLEQLLQAESEKELVALLEEYGVALAVDTESGRLLREETLLGILSRTYAELAEMAPNEKVLLLWRYPYDCNNIKAAIKAFVRKIDPSSMLFDFGTVEIDDVKRAVQTGDFSALPTAMAEAADRAVKLYAKTKDPQSIDLCIDRACYADMLEAATESGVAFAEELVREKIDLTNLLIAVRILRMRSGEIGNILLGESLIAGGKLSRTWILSQFALGEKVLWKQLLYTEYEKLAEAVAATEATLTAIERSADNFFMEKLKEVKYVSYGAEVLIAFLQAHEYEVRNLRIILAGKAAGLSVNTIRERIRDSYV